MEARGNCHLVGNKMRVIYDNNHEPAIGRYKDAVVDDGTNNLVYLYDSCGTYVRLAPGSGAASVAAAIHAATSKAIPVNADELGLVDSAASNVLKKLTWANVKATLKTYFDTIYAAIVHTHAQSDITGLVSDLAGKQPLDATLTALAGVTTAADKLIYSTGPDVFTTTDLSVTARTLLDDTSISAMRTTLGLAIGTDVEAHDADLTTIAGLSPSNDDFLQRKAGAWANRTVAQVKTDLGISGTNTGDQTITLTGDVTGSGTGSFAATIGTNKVTNAKMAQMVAHTFKGNNTGSTADPLDLTIAQLTAELNAFVGDSGAGGTKGLVPAPITGDATKFLKGNGTWATIPGGGDLLSTNNLSDLTNFATARANLGLTIGTNVQAFDATLAALAAYNTNGILTQTAADTFAGRTITGTANQVVVTNGDGVAGNPTLSLPQDIATTSTPTFGATTISAATGDALTIVGSGTNATILRFKDDATERGAIFSSNGTTTLNVRSNAALQFVVNNGTTPVSSFWDGTGLSIGSGATPTHSLTLPSVGTGLAVYNTVDQTTNYERGLLQWSGNVLTLSTAAGGTGINRQLTISANSQSIDVGGTGNNKINLNFTTGTANGVGARAVGTLTATGAGTQVGFSVLPTINQTSGTSGYTGFLLNVTETAVGSGTKLLCDMQVGGTSRFSLTPAGNMTLDSGSIASGSANHITLTPGTSKLVKIAVLRQDDTTNAYKNGSVILTGWGVFAQGAASNKSEAITFGITFLATPIVLVSFGGDNVGGATTLGAGGNIDKGPVTIKAYSETTTGFTAHIHTADGTSFSATANAFYKWLAIGEF